MTRYVYVVQARLWRNGASAISTLVLIAHSPERAEELARERLLSKEFITDLEWLEPLEPICMAKRHTKEKFLRCLPAGHNGEARKIEYPEETS